MNVIEKRLAELGIALPEATRPVANYVPWTRSGNQLFVAGQIPLAGGKPTATGKLGGGVSLGEGQAAARQCAINILAQIKAACGGDLGKVKQVLKLTGFVNCTPEFTEIPQVINGASDLMVAVFGEAGRHARTSVGAPTLPLNVPVEIDAIVELA
jgi:enamine deaminase RidA (YjgF/YER057c/UK114 family)